MSGESSEDVGRARASPQSIQGSSGELGWLLRLTLGAQQGLVLGSKWAGTELGLVSGSL